MLDDIVEGVTEIFGELAGDVVGDIAGRVMKEFSIKEGRNEVKNQEQNQDKKEKNKNKDKKKKKQKTEEIPENPVIKTTAVSKDNITCKNKNFSLDNTSVEDLRRAVVWSEILGEPACKKRRRTAGRRF